MNTIAEKRQSLLQSHAHLMAEQKKYDQEDMMFLSLNSQAAGIWDQICLLDQVGAADAIAKRGGTRAGAGRKNKGKKVAYRLTADEVEVLRKYRAGKARRK